MKSMTRDSYLLLFRLRLDVGRSVGTAAACRPLEERDYIEYVRDVPTLTGAGFGYATGLLDDPRTMPLTAKRAIAEDDYLRDRLSCLFEDDPDPKVRVAIFGPVAMEDIDPPTSPDGLRTDTVYGFPDLDRLPTTWVVRHLAGGFSPDHPVVIRHDDWDGTLVDSLQPTALRRRGDVYRYATEAAKRDFERMTETEHVIGIMRDGLPFPDWTIWTRKAADGRLMRVEAQRGADGPRTGATVVRDTDGHVTGLEWEGRTYSDPETLAAEWGRLA
ncbi:hypothetical protein [Bifidobacterium callitrichidarum]|uniref:Uncharacterized protein n=1 Tax=Bifidobacterium callitrichidarum TaxID=2052941 RepID=A0A2U2N913_9BIFI|nr:hypothetical protein [Bifidobacterium callitrichidarum]PWG65592.1 hypothetical protein DF196_06560 [Bifidobacterium callitrichidarum]